MSEPKVDRLIYQSISCDFETLLPMEFCRAVALITLFNVVMDRMQLF